MISEFINKPIQNKILNFTNITMEDYENIYNSICRLCLSYSDRKNMVSLFDENSEDGGLTPYAKAVATFTNIILSKQDCFPGNMCSKCLLLLKQAIYFKFMAESSDNCLKQLKNSARNDEDLKEKVVEYTMLNFYFPNFKATKTGFKSKKSSKEQNKVTYIEIQLGKYEQAKENPVTSTNCSENEILDPESDTEKNILENSVLVGDKAKHLDDSNIFKSITTVTTQKLLENEESYPKGKRRIRKKRKRYLKKNLVCNICNKVMANQVTLRNHMMRHNGGRFICELCGKRYPLCSQLQIHQLTKHGTGPYLQCPQCPFKAPGKKELTEHKRIHTGERPFACDKCGLTFRRQAIWRKHLVHHSEKKVQCPHCPKKFYLRSDMVGHINSIHERLYVYSCSECDVTYKRSCSVRQHMAKIHGIPREKQGKIAMVKNGAANEHK